MDNIVSIIFSENFLSTVIRVGVPLMFASMSAYISAMSGMPNIAVEGIMTFSALMAVLGSYWTQSAFLGLMIAIASGILMSLLIALMTMKLGTDPFLVGIALNTFSASFTIFLLYLFSGNKGISANLNSAVLPSIDVPFLEKIPILRAIFSGHYLLTYVCYACIIIIIVLVYKTTFGLRLKASGLNADAARSVGINVNKMQLIAIIISGLLASLGGAYMTMGYLSAFSRNMVAGRGWIGFASQALAGNSFLGLSLTTILFSFFQAIVSVFSTLDIPSDLLTTVPYMGVLLGVVVYSVVTFYKNKKRVGKNKN